jgi:hypothetical protein
MLFSYLRSGLKSGLSYYDLTKIARAVCVTCPPATDIQVAMILTRMEEESAYVLLKFAVFVYEVFRRCKIGLVLIFNYFTAIFSCRQMNV